MYVLMILVGLFLMAIGFMIMLTILGFFVGLPIAWLGWWLILLGLAKKLNPQED